MQRGTLYGVSVGPGDPELLTIKAVKILKHCPVIAVPRTRGERSLALEIASQALDLSQKEIIYLDFAMSRNAEEVAAFHERNSATVMTVLDSGRDLALPNLGDISVYSSFSYIAERVAAASYEVKWIPGVTSFCASAAALGQSLTAMQLPLLISPGSAAETRELLQIPGGKILMKSGKAVAEVLALIKELGLEARTSAVADCGLETERVFTDFSQINSESYFLTIIIRP